MGEKLSKTHLGLLRSPVIGKGKQVSGGKRVGQEFFCPLSPRHKDAENSTVGPQGHVHLVTASSVASLPGLQRREGRATATATHGHVPWMLQAALRPLPAGLREVNGKREKVKRKPGALRPSPKSAFFSIY